jgi:alpha-N-acetylglucosaminidase
MLDLGMTPILPAFTGFVPLEITRVAPNATVVRGSEWNGFGNVYSNVTFLEPFDPLFGELQGRLMRIQNEVYGSTGDVYTLDQYNENVPFSGEVEYLRNISRETMTSLRNANPNAVWLMQVPPPFPLFGMTHLLLLSDYLYLTASFGFSGSRGLICLGMAVL